MTSFIIVIATVSALASLAYALKSPQKPKSRKRKKTQTPHYKPWAIIDNEFIEFEEVN